MKCKQCGRRYVHERCFYCYPVMVEARNSEGKATGLKLRGNIFPGEGYPRRYYIWTGEKRPPKAGEYYLSGAVPTVYRTNNDLSYPYHIMRPATEEELQCPCCGQRRPTQPSV